MYDRSIKMVSLTSAVGSLLVDQTKWLVARTFMFLAPLVAFVVAGLAPLALIGVAVGNSTHGSISFGQDVLITGLMFATVCLVLCMLVSLATYRLHGDHTAIHEGFALSWILSSSLIVSISLVGTAVVPCILALVGSILAAVFFAPALGRHVSELLS